MPELLRLTWALAHGRAVSDLEFDRLLPAEARAPSERHWTPVDTATLAARLLTETGASRVLDVGSGVGKFCIIGALTTRATFTGIEQRPHLVEIARGLARRHAVPRVRFIHGKMEHLDWSSFDAFYFFNPFHEHLTDLCDPIDDSIEFSRSWHAYYTTIAREKLMALPVGVRVVTCHGLGAGMPLEFHLEFREPCGDLYLDLWVKGC